MLDPKRVLDALQHSDALQTGHFRLRSGMHSDRFLQTAIVLQYPEYGSAIGAEIASRVKVKGIDTVIGPASRGIILAYEVARALGARAMFGDKRGDETVLHPGFKIQPRDRVVVVDDMLTVGRSVLQLMNLTQQYQAQVVATGFIVDCSSPPVDFGVPKVSLAQLDIPTYNPSDCPMCAEGVPLVNP